MPVPRKSTSCTPTLIMADLSATPQDMKPEGKSAFEHNESVDGADGELELETLSTSEEAALRKSLLRKLDTRILPVLALLFLFSFL